MKDVRYLALASIFLAMITLVTMYGMVPIVWGYLNLGDAMIMLSATILPVSLAGLVGGIASALADLLGGYSQYALFTLVIKALEAMMVAALFNKIKHRSKHFVPFILAGLWVAVAYGLVDAFIYQDWMVGLASLGLNSIQGLTSSLLGISFSYTITPKLRKLLHNNASY